MLRRGSMALFIDILTKVTLPIIALVALGYVLQRKLKLDIGTLNRVQVYVVMPAFLVHFLATGKQPISVVWPVFYFGIVQFLILIPLGWLTGHPVPAAPNPRPDDGSRHRLRQRRLLRHSGDAAGVRAGLPDLSVGDDRADVDAGLHGRRLRCWRRRPGRHPRRS